MASFEAHIAQANHNLEFLESLNSVAENWDWKVTVCFYTCVHIVNAHLAASAGLHYRQHIEVEQALNSENSTSLAKLPQDVFLAYRKLKNLSRVSRYLCTGARGEDDNTALITRAGHFEKALRQLNILLNWCDATHGYKFNVKTIACPGLKTSIEHFIPLAA